MTENVFEYDPTLEDTAWGSGSPNWLKGYHFVKMDDGTTRYIPDDEQEF